MYIAKKHEVKLLEASRASNTDASDSVYTRARRVLQESKSDYQRYVAEFGYKHCCHVPRLHGDEWSLLTEVVVNYHKSNLFDEPKRAKKQDEESKKNLKRIRTDGDVVMEQSKDSSVDGLLDYEEFRRA